ncbi:hypothetical protein XA68_13836 [Ophiocordyceps unilateralis]|uniref:Activator of Hsp90 ATPase AHSA1-like N-terminal domain-containing protein n=1 Tax=Ophiocordyceps unilateralis TaxID=268505 RepID=A0A2A9PND0_OPHUN|nr:hypothetical protein XA68_13836 [Ophiocordyceps unilateralis]
MMKAVRTTIPEVTCGKRASSARLSLSGGVCGLCGVGPAASLTRHATYACTFVRSLAQTSRRFQDLHSRRPRTFAWPISYSLGSPRPSLCPLREIYPKYLPRDEHNARPLQYFLTMVLHNPNNWHWVNKDVSQWTRQWLEQNLTTLNVRDGDVEARITGVQSMDGDVDVSQRKGKVITIFDIKLVLEYAGSAPDVEDVSGTVTVPEIAHDTDEDEYVFEVDIISESKEKLPVKQLVRSKLVSLLRKEFQKLAPALIDEHGKDIQHTAGSNPSSGFSTPKLHTEASSVQSSKPSGSSTGTGGIVNTVTVTDNEEFRTTAEELYQTFVDPSRLAAFTRSPPKLFEGAKIGGKFELFGGNVSDRVRPK